MSIHSCNYCNYTSDRLYNLKVHVRNKHANNKNEMYVGNNAPPTTLNECTYCDYNTTTKCNNNIRRHVRNKHTEKNYLEKDHGKTMKYDQHKEFRKLKILIKKFAILGVDLRLLKRSVDRLVEINENDYNFTVQELKI